MRLPLRVRLTLAFAVGMAVVLSALGWFVYWRVGKDLLASADLSLRARGQVIEGAIAAQGDQGITAFGSLIDADESFVQVLDWSGHVVYSSENAVVRPLFEGGTLNSLGGPQFFTQQRPRIDADPVRLLVVPVGSGEGQRFVVVGATLGDRRDALDRLLVAFAIGGPVALILTSLAGWLVAGAALRPVEAMRREAAAISASEPERRLPVPSGRDELARLGATLNSMLDRMQEAFDKERRFVDDASHELRTPLSILKAELDLALARSRTPEELEAAVRSASAETDRLVRLAEDLLVLARVEHGRLPLHREEISLARFLEETVAPYRPRAAAAGVRLELDAEPGTALVDPVHLRRAVANLLDNALRHASHGGVVRVAAGRTGDAVTISVQDSGSGFPVDFLGRAFEPFTRSHPDGSGDGAGAGAGLGLAIVRAVAEAHGGTARAENLPDGGARVSVALRG